MSVSRSNSLQGWIELSQQNVKSTMLFLISSMMVTQQLNSSSTHSCIWTKCNESAEWSWPCTQKRYSTCSQWGEIKQKWDKKLKKILLNIIKFTLSSENSSMSTAKYLIYTQSNYTKYSIILFQKILTRCTVFTQ